MLFRSHTKNLTKKLNFLNHKILSITCDNASANDTMIDHLAIILETFPGSANQTRCFTHILNLAVKCIMKQFDAPKKNWQKGKVFGLNIEDELEGLEDEPKDPDDEEISNEGTDGEDVDEGEVLDGRDDMTQQDVDELDESVKPVRTVLMKASYPNNEQSFFVITSLSFERLPMR